MAKSYTIGALAGIAGVSVRTLHHYDHIGLLVPDARKASGYRVYGEAELLRLQQILLYRELEIPLERIGAIIDSPGHDPATALVAHRAAIQERRLRLDRLLATIDKTIARLGGGDSTMKDEELYEGFDGKEIEAMAGEAEDRWGRTEAYRQSRERLAKMTKAEWAGVKAEGLAVDRACGEAKAAGVRPDSPEAMRLMARKAEHLRAFYEPEAGLFKGLGEMYVVDARFRSNYENITKGLAEWMRDAMASFAERGMRSNAS
ncbi:MAG TPA: MerR family transcriptional regulator [Rectinemataceae bacterium]|nr:MerR family transcriptional regulator [Rectinemataceae bacterium]